MHAPPVSLAWALADELPPGTGWLGARELQVLGGLRVEARRRSWLLGRLVAKRAVGEEVEILAREDGAPRAWRGDELLRGGLSLSHSGGRAVAAWSAEHGRIGVDLELVEPRSEGFVRDYLTRAEQRFVAGAKDAAEAANLVWSAKEAVLKATREGLTVDTLRVAVSVERWGDEQDWRRWSARHGGAVFEGWWRRWDGFVVTVVRG